jgi:membrane protein DedA with SNARE-associated domain
MTEGDLSGSEMELYRQWLSAHGYGGLFVLLASGIIGLPVPDDALLMLAGYLAARGMLELTPVLLVAALASICGITISYVLGRWLSGWLIAKKAARRRWLNTARLERVRCWFDRVGRWGLTVAYFVPGVRHLTALVAGMAKLRWPVFTLFAYSGALVWTATFVGLGYSVGERWQQVLATLELHRLIVVVVAAGALATYLTARWTTRRKGVRP